MTKEYHVRMDIDDDGKVTRCEFVGAASESGVMFSGHDSLDRCAIALRKEFRREALARDFDRIIANAPNATTFVDDEAAA